MNEEQSAVLNSNSQNILVIAGAGSGKTHTLVERIKKLVAQGIKPSEISAITYTISAAAEIRERIGFGIGYCGTLHGWCLRLINENPRLAGVSLPISIIDDDAREKIARQIALEMKSKISWSKLDKLLREDELHNSPAHAMINRDQLVAVEYHRQARRSSALDFDAILWHGRKIARMLNLNHDLSDGKFWRHLFVDEFQDCAPMDAEIYRTLPAATKFFIGDPDQAIFGFRGGDVGQILNVARDASFSVFKLERNHRCAVNICSAAQHLIERNTNRYPKATRAVAVGGLISIKACDLPAQEHCAVADAMLKQIKDGRSCAVLCRTNRIADGFRDHLRMVGIEVSESERQEQPSDFRRFLLFLTLLSNPSNDFVAHKFLSEQFTQDFADKMKSEATILMKPINEHCSSLKYERITTGAEVAKIPSLSSFSYGTFNLVAEASAKLDKISSDWSVADLIAALNRPESQRQTNGVTITTIHSAKGREWDFVALAGFEDEATPGNKPDTDIEEERRLAYVALTRARSELLITYCSARPESRGPNLPPSAPVKRTPSRFIQESVL